MIELAHTADLLLDVFDKVGFFGELLLVDTLHRVHLIVGWF